MQHIVVDFFSIKDTVLVENLQLLYKAVYIPKVSGSSN